MRIFRHFSAVVFTALLLTHSHAHAFSAKIIPSVVLPGDAFAVRLTGLGPQEEPSVFFDGREMYFDACGPGCYIGLGSTDIEARPGVYRMRISVGEKSVRRNLTVGKPRFPELRLTLPEEKVFPSPEDLERAGREDLKLKSLWRVGTDRLWQDDFIMPLENDVSTVFGAKRIMNGKKISVHRGVDIRGKAGEKVRASNTGRVVLAEDLFFGGNTIILDHGRGIFSVYMHLSSMIAAVGETVLKGDIIGLVGSTGRSSAPHLHFSVKFGERSINPVSLMNLKL